MLQRAKGRGLFIAAWLISVLLLASFPFEVTAQSETELVEASKNLPIQLTDEELTRLDEIGLNQMATAPPAAPIRHCAEWEPATGVLIRYDGMFFGISYALIADFAENVTVYVLCTADQQADCYDDMSAGGVNMDNVEFIFCTTNSMWTRDYGPEYAYSNGVFSLVDHIYNRPRPDDDLVPWVLGTEWSLPVHGTDLITAGGNFMSDGHGIAFSTDLILEENPTLTYEDIAGTMHDYLGIEEYHVLPDTTLDGLHHIDCWAKLLNEETILVKQVWPDHPDYATLEASAAYLATLTNCYGRPYNVVRVYCGKIRQQTAAGYTNSLILNDKVYVPLYGIDEDADAIATYQAAMPGYEVIGFQGGWITDDAIHCRATGVIDKYMLVLDTSPLPDQESNGAFYRVTAGIADMSETGLVADSLLVFWRLEGAPEFSSVVMQPTGEPDVYCGDIPKQADLVNIDYYVSAKDYSGRVVTSPRVAPAVYYTFNTGETQTTDATTPEVRIALDQNHPNPFNPSTTIRFFLPKRSFVSLKIYDASGREVSCLLSREMVEGGHTITWDGKDASGAPMNSGVYFYRLDTGSEKLSKKMVLLR